MTSAFHDAPCVICVYSARCGIAVNANVRHRCVMARDDPHFRLRIPEALKQRVQEAADGSRRSMNAEVIDRLEASFLMGDDYVEMEEEISRLNSELRGKEEENSYLKKLLDKLSEDFASISAVGNKLEILFERYMSVYADLDEGQKDILVKLLTTFEIEPEIKKYLNDIQSGENDGEYDFVIDLKKVPKKPAALKTTQQKEPAPQTERKATPPTSYTAEEFLGFLNLPTNAMPIISAFGIFDIERTGEGDFDFIVSRDSADKFMRNPSSANLISNVREILEKLENEASASRS